MATKQKQVDKWLESYHRRQERKALVVIVYIVGLFIYLIFSSLEFIDVLFTIVMSTILLLLIMMGFD